ncbi:hypothetical protein [Cohnella herbarum]|uniref:Uncharacterized protein n=1 Tax=Cohnella herbarum TaxID=2728023 RepID=A0A7Z2VEW3_9BACL|nr:hypothetical protein [Cohnella herbarum]QJD81766.1 hypothetical protein HH215_00270 [Cohnella herbarum]
MSDDRTKDNLVLFPKTLDYYQIHLTKMLETERYGDAKGLLLFLLQCHGEAERHHTEWQALLGWLNAAFPEAVSHSEFGQLAEAEQDEDEQEDDIFRRRVEERFESDTDYIPQLLASLYNGDDPEQQLLILSQLMHVAHPDIDLSLRQWLARKEYIPPVQFRALQALRKQGAAGPVSFWRDGESLTVESGDTPLVFSEFPQGVLHVLDRVRQTAEVSDPTLSYFAEEMWKECVEVAYGTSIYKSMVEDDDGSSDLWGAALHQLLMEKLHGKHGDEWIREQYGITGELRFRYEQALRWLRQYSIEPRPNHT